MKKIRCSINIVLVLLFSFPVVFITNPVSAGSFTEKDRELLIRLDERLEQIDKRFEQIDNRFEELRHDMDKRFEQVDKRFEQVDKRFETLTNLMICIVAAFAAIVAATMGFAIWDRRTMIRPFEDKVRKMDEDILKDRKRLDDFLDALRSYARTNKKLAEILRDFSLL